MPKIFGNVVLLPGQTRCICRLCNFQWNADQQEYDDLLSKRKVTCPICRLTKEHIPGVPIESTGKLSKYIIDPMIRSALLPVIKNDDKYKDYNVPIKSLACGHLFTIKSRYMNSWLKDPECLKCNPNKASSLSDEQEIKIAQPIKPKATVKDTQNIVQTKDVTQRISREQIESDMKQLIGQESTDSVIIDVDINNAEVIIHCKNCGKERHIAYATYKKHSDDCLTCPDCRIDKPKLEEIYTKYIGKIFNGMRISDIYKGGNKHTLCTVQCLENKDHVFKDKELGIIINNRFYCPTCTGNGKRDIAEVRRIERIFNIACRKFLSRTSMRSINYGYNRNDIQDKLNVTADEFYKLALRQGGSICDYCKNKGTCKVEHSTETSISYITGQADLLDSINDAKIAVSSHYPSIYGPNMREGASVCDIDIPRELIMFRDAYRGRDKLVYRFCKCIKHGTEMLLSETEILDFDHQCCLDANKRFVRFFDLDNDILLGNKKYTKNS